MRKWFKAGAPLLMALFIAMGILAGCSNKPEYKQYKNTFITVDGVEVFNTVFTVMAWEKSDKDWNEHYEKVQELVLKYHKLFDYYDEYEGVNNIMTINKQAGIKPVKVEQEIIDMIKQAKELYDATGQETNIAMGSVTEIWHKVREHNMPGDGDEIEEADMILPTQEELDAAGQHTDFDRVIINEEESTVYLEDPEMKLDVGAIAKGYAAQLVADQLTEAGMPNGLMSAGGNIVSFGPPDLPEKKTWGVAITDPIDSNKYLDDVVFELKGRETVVSSGDYERFFTIGGKRYHHLIDPKTWQPGDYFAQVTVVTDDSGQADFLSTTFFLLPYEEGVKLAEEMDIAVAWVFKDGTLKMNEKAKSMLK
ncbi:MAG: FAD:protein FMN transferase [Clostridium sp.]|nr:FAD:protein FMN transferase [Clostridium sp.]